MIFGLDKCAKATFIREKLKYASSIENSSFRIKWLKNKLTSILKQQKQLKISTKKTKNTSLEHMRKD